MTFYEAVFLISCFLVFYNYAGYAVIAYLLNKFNKQINKNAQDSSFYPSISFIVAAYNEEDFIEKKIINSISQNYPSDQIEFIFITDGSIDETANIVSRYSNIKLLHEQVRKGKSAAINRAVTFASNEILIFSDANTILNTEATLNIARHYIDKKIGGVAGEKKIISFSETSTNEVGEGEGLYWKYESLLKKIDSDYYSVVGAAGELFSLRRKLYKPVPDHVILDDFIISLRITQDGYRVKYEPEAYAMETPSFSFKDEQKRKIRIAAGGFQSIVMLWPLLLFWKQPKLSFLYISHRVLRWAVSPLCLLTAFISNMMLCLGTNNFIYNLLFLLQVLFYLMAFSVAYILPNTRIKLLKLAYYFAFMNISVFFGFIRFLRGTQSAVWEKSKRTLSGPQ